MNKVSNAIKINFDVNGNPETPTLVLAKRNGDKLGKIFAHSIELSGNMNDADEISFSVYKYIDCELDPLWDKITNFKLVYYVEADRYFEMVVETDESNETVKTCFCQELGQAELSQINLYNIQINTDGDDGDIARDDYVIPTVLYRVNGYDEEHAIYNEESGIKEYGITEYDKKFYKEIKKENMPIPFPDYKDASLLHRILKDKAPHYSVDYVDPTITHMQRMFEFSDNSIYDACQEIAEELNCLFVFNSNSDSNGKIQRTISIYDLESNCKSCGYRGDFIDVCPECGENDYHKIDDGYGEDTLIFVTSDEIADNIQLSSDTDEIKNCFKLEAGDDLMTATIKNCNPNGSDYIWHLSENMKSDMSDELVAKINEYDLLYESYQTGKIALDEAVLSKYNDLVNKYNVLMNKLDDEKLETIETPIVGFPALIDAYYNTFDMYLYLQSGLMPTIDTARPDVKEEIAELTVDNLSPVAVNLGSSSSNPLKACSVSTADSLVLSMAKTLVDSRYKVKIADGSTLGAYVNGKYVVGEYVEGESKYWRGKIILIAYSDDEVTATTDTIEVEVNDDYETFVKRKLEKALSSDDSEEMSISGLFKKNLVTDLEDDESEEDSFEHALKEYSLNRLISFHDACQSCIDILIEQGVADGETWGNVDRANLYEDLYMPYYNKLSAVQAEIAIRDEEIALIVGVYDEDGDLVEAGLQTIIEGIKADIQDALDFEKYLGEELWLEFCSFRREDKYSNDNYISEGLNNAQMISKANEFIQVAYKEIHRSAELQCSISANLKNLLVVEKFKPLADSFKVGNWLRVMIDDKVYRLRLINYEIDYDNLDEISVEFSDAVKSSSSIKSVQEVLAQASSMATSYSSVQRQAKQGEESNAVLNGWVASGLDATNVKIIGGAEGQSQTWDSHGMLFREYDETIGGYSPEQMKIINSTMAITDDNWETTKTAVGKYYYPDPKTGKMIMSYGVNAETIIGKLVIGENLAFANDAGTMTFDNSGLVVSNDTNTVSISPNEDSVFNIKKGGSNVFWFDDDGNLVITGDIIANNLTLAEGATISSGSVGGFHDIAISGDYNDLENKPNLANVATSGNYNDLSNKPSFADVATSGSYNDLSDKPSLANVATSGDYDDLSGKPSLATVATTGRYTDLTGNVNNAGKLLYVGDDGSVTTLGVDELRTLLGI